MDKYKQVLGAKGERLAIQFLRQRRYKIIARNFRCRLGEIDIIARQEKAIVFIEVKTRSDDKFGLPQEAVKTEKIRQLKRIAQFYIKSRANPYNIFRFDVVAIILKERPKIQLIRDILP